MSEIGSPATRVSRTQHAAVLACLLLIAILLRLGTWWLFPNIHHADEIFQYREQAFRLAEGFGVVPWEYLGGTRSWALPGLLAGLHFVTASAGLGLESWHFAIALTMSLLSLAAVWVMAAYGRWIWGLKGMALAGGLGVVWFELIYFAPKTLTTPVATHILLIALAVWGLGIEEVSRPRLFGGAALAATSFVVRPQLLPAILIIGGWVVWRHRRREGLLPFALGLMFGISVFGLVDLLVFDYPFEWLVNSYRWQITEGVFAQFGETAWYYYLAKLLENWGYLAALLAVPIALGVRQQPVLGVGSAAVLVAHSLLVHKEYRFIYGSIVLALILAAIGLVTSFKWISERRPFTKPTGAMLIAALILATSAAGFQRSISGVDSAWDRGAQLIAAFDRLRTEDSLEALVIEKVEWWRTPGYSGLGVNIPIRAAIGEESASDLSGGYTHLVTTRPPDDLADDHIQVHLDVSGEQTIFLYRSLRPYEHEFTLVLNDQIQMQWEAYKSGLSDQVAP